jgi:uncharacterized protein (DUF305 family)
MAAAAPLLALVLGACSRATSAPAMPMPAAAARADTTRPSPRQVDAAFMQHMLAHHAQALEMTRLAPLRSRRVDIRLLAERIDVSQRDEIALMQRLLRARGVEPPPIVATGAHAGHGAAAGAHANMPGMLSDDEMARLTGASGPDFDRLFLQYMIRHHEGALRMVADFLATPGAAGDAEIFQFASDIDADQRAEIRRMRSMPDAPPSGAPPR